MFSSPASTMVLRRAIVAVDEQCNSQVRTPLGSSTAILTWLGPEGLGPEGVGPEGRAFFVSDRQRWVGFALACWSVQRFLSFGSVLCDLCFTVGIICSTQRVVLALALPRYWRTVSCGSYVLCPTPNPGSPWGNAARPRPTPCAHAGNGGVSSLGAAGCCVCPERSPLTAQRGAASLFRCVEYCWRGAAPGASHGPSSMSAVMSSTAMQRTSASSSYPSLAKACRYSTRSRPSSSADPAPAGYAFGLVKRQHRQHQQHQHQTSSTSTSDQPASVMLAPGPVLALGPALVPTPPAPASFAVTTFSVPPFERNLFTRQLPLPISV
jgi:hypothetical protein